MKRLSWVLHISLVAVLHSVVLYSQPQLEMADEQDWGTVIPIGELQSKQSVTARVVIKNVGDSTLVIQGVRVQCGCTSAPLADTVIAPGGQTIMNVKLDLPTGSGLLQKYVTVYSNDPAGTHVLRLKVNVERPIQFGSSFLAFDKAVVGRPTRATLSIAMNADTTATVVVTSGSPGLTVTTPMPIKLSKKESREIELVYIPQSEGMFSVKAVVSASLPGYQLVEFSGYGVAESAK